MSLALYFDVHASAEIRRALVARDIDVLSAQDDSADRLTDDELLNRAGELGRVVFTRDEDFLKIAASRQQGGEYFAGIIYAHQLRVPIGQCIEELELIAKCNDLADFVGRLEHLPLR